MISPLLQVLRFLASSYHGGHLDSFLLGLLFFQLRNSADRFGPSCSCSGASTYVCVFDNFANVCLTWSAHVLDHTLRPSHSIISTNHAPFFFSEHLNVFLFFEGNYQAMPHAISNLSCIVKNTTEIGKEVRQCWRRCVGCCMKNLKGQKGRLSAAVCQSCPVCTQVSHTQRLKRVLRSGLPSFSLPDTALQPPLPASHT